MTPKAMPYRVQGVHVAAFAAQRASRARRKTFVGGFLAACMTSFLAHDITHAEDVVNLVSRDGVTIVFIVVGIVIAYRCFRRSRRLQAIVEAAHLQPIAVWGLRDKVLYPLDPRAPREKLSIVLDATEQRLIYEKPRAPIGGPPEPQP